MGLVNSTRVPLFCLIAFSKDSLLGLFDAFLAGGIEAGLVLESATFAVVVQAVKKRLPSRKNMAMLCINRRI